MNTTNLIPLAITLGAVFAAFKFGSPMVKGMALGVAGVMAANNLPLVRDGLQIRLIA